MSNSILIMDGDAMTRALRRIAHEILEHNPDPSRILPLSESRPEEWNWHVVWLI